MFRRTWGWTWRRQDARRKEKKWSCKRARLLARQKQAGPRMGAGRGRRRLASTFAEPPMNRHPKARTQFHWDILSLVKSMMQDCQFWWSRRRIPKLISRRKWRKPPGIHSFTLSLWKQTRDFPTTPHTFGYACFNANPNPVPKNAT